MAEEVLDFDDDNLRAIAEVFFQEGNREYREKEWENAIYFYTEGIKVKCKDDELNAKLYSNRATAHFQSELAKEEETCQRRGRNLPKKLAKEEGDRARERLTYYGLGNAHFAQGNFRKAIDCHENHLKLCKDRGNRTGERCAYGILGDAHFRLGELQQALTYYRRYLEIAEEDGDRKGEGRAYGKLGDIYMNLGDVKKAVSCYEFQQQLAKQMIDKDGEGLAYHNLGVAYRKLGDFKKAIDYHECHLNISKEVGDVAGEGKAYGGLGIAYCTLGDWKRGLGFREKSLKIAQKLGDKSGEASAYLNLANICVVFGDFQKAIDYCELLLEISINMGDKDAEGRGYLILGRVHKSLGMPRKAKYYYERSLKNFKEMGKRAEEGRAYGYLGDVYHTLGDFENSIYYLERSLKIAIETGDAANEGCIASNLGNEYYHIGNFEKAIEQYELGRSIAKQLGSRIGEGESYANLGNVYTKLGELNKAVELYGLGLRIFKEVGDRVNEARIYRSLGETYETMGSLQEACDYYQSSVTILNDVRINLHANDEWKISLRDLYGLVYTALCGVLLKQGKTVEALCAAEKGRAQALNDLMKSNYGLGTDDSDLSAEEGMDDDIFCGVPCNTIFTAFSRTRVINFWVLQNRKDVFIRTKELSELSQQGNGMQSFQMLIKSSFNDIGVRAGVKCEDRSLNQLRKPSMASENDERTPSSTSQYEKRPLRTLYELVIDPIVDLVQGDELIFVPEGPLCLAPYAAFMDSNSNYLCESFRIRVIPSLTSLKLITNCPADYHCKTGALLVGDPWVQEVVDYKGQRLQQLPCAREEVEMIGRILKTAPLTGKEATKDEVLRRLSSVTLVHIAAHGLMETGEIALAPNPTRASPRPKEDDFLLTMADVLNVKLRARLVVLSCCHSARGEIKAEGVVGIARAVLGAGARSVLVSLWAIDDAATLEFMKSFYEDLAKGRSASEALNRAMNSMRESEEFGEVKYWAPFVLIGDDVTLEFDESD